MLHMELVKLRRYFRVERSSFIDERFYSKENFLYLTESGVFEYSVNGQTYRAGELECVFYKKGAYYERTVLSPVVLHIFELEQAFVAFDAPVSFADHQRIYGDLALLNRINGADRKNLPYIEHLLNDILYTYQQEQAGFQDVCPANDKRIEKALSIIHGNFHKEISVHEVAASVHLSYPQFNRLFVKQMGITPIRYIHQLRSDKAKGLLYTTDLPIKAVAAECGFRDIYYFSNFFKSVTGISPTQYRAGKH